MFRGGGCESVGVVGMRMSDENVPILSEASAQGRVEEQSRGAYVDAYSTARRDRMILQVIQTLGLQFIRLNVIPGLGARRIART